METSRVMSLQFQQYGRNTMDLYDIMKISVMWSLHVGDFSEREGGGRDFTFSIQFNVPLKIFFI